ncbi:MAG: T9SS type A sorting domain-containing protein, partial [Bacteroidota bacterium]
LALNLTINNDVGSTLSVSACNSYTLNAITYAIGGNYTQHLTSYTGCDSMLALNLTINNDVGSTLSVSACNSYTLNSTAYNASGTYVQNFAASNGCDSILTLYLSIDSSNAAVTITDPTLTAQSIGTYQWLNCSMDFAPILNATNQSYTATANGDYAVIITNGTCLDTSACYTIYTVGFNQIGSNEELIISPNPATNQFTIENSQLKINSIHIYNVLGSVVLERIANSQKAIDISTWKAGVYFVEVETEKGIVRKKLVKE